jgi:putative transposase
LLNSPKKGADVDVLRQMVQFMTQRLMELDVEGRCGAGYDEKNPERLNSRNGYQDRTWDTRAGSIELKIPKVCQGSYCPEFLEPRRTAGHSPPSSRRAGHLHPLGERPGRSG